MEGFTYHEHELFPFIEVKLHGKAMSIRELVKAAESMRQELLTYGISVRLGQADGNG